LFVVALLIISWREFAARKYQINALATRNTLPAKSSRLFGSFSAVMFSTSATMYCFHVDLF